LGKQADNNREAYIPYMLISILLHKLHCKIKAVVIRQPI
jgi:hypothetical protein